MSTSVWPYLPPEELKVAEDESLARELTWLLDSLHEQLAGLKSGLEECYALLAPIEPGSTLVLSSPRSESLKGHITRVGTEIVKGQLNLRLKTYPPISLSLSSDHPLALPSLASLRTLLNQSLDCIDITRWTGDRHSAAFISSQLRLLHSILLEALGILKGPNLLIPTNPASNSHTHPNAHPNPHPPTSLPLPDNTTAADEPPAPLESPWYQTPPSPNSFTPPLPPTLSIHLSLLSPSLHLTLRVLEPTSLQPNLGSRFALAIGAQRRLEHDEMDDVFVYRGEEVRVKEKVRVESSADPSLLSLEAKVGQLVRGVASMRGCLGVVMGGGGLEGEGEGE